MVAAGAELWHKGTMETGLDLDQASRETLLAVIAEQQGVISELRRRVENLEARLSGGGPGSRMPGHKPAARRKKAAGEEKKPRRKRPHGFARPRMEPTRQVVHAPEFCPECHTADYRSFFSATLADPPLGLSQGVVSGSPVNKVWGLSCWPAVVRSWAPGQRVPGFCPSWGSVSS